MIFAPTGLLAAPFRGFFLGRLVSLLGSSMTSVALAFAVLDASGRADDLGIILAAQLVPHLALLLVGGVIADRFPRRVVLVVANLGAGLTQGTVALVLLTGHYSLPVVAALEVANGALEAFTSPALRGIVPELVPPADLQRANSLLSSTNSATKIFGPTVAGLLVVAVGGGWAIGVDAVSFLVAAGLLARLRLAPPTAPAGRPHLIADLREGWRAFRGVPWVWAASLSFAVLNLVNTGTWQILGPTLTRQRSGEAAWGTVLSVRAIGLLVMSMIMYRLVLRHPLRTGQLFGVLGALSLVGLGLGVSAPWLMVCAFLGGMGFAAPGITWDSALQTHVPRAVLSRISSYDEMLAFIAIPVGQLLVGPAAARWGANTVVLSCAVVFVLAMLAPLLVRTVRDLPAAATPPHDDADPLDRPDQEVLHPDGAESDARTT